MAVFLSYLFVFGIIGLSTLLQKYRVLDDEGARKFIHIGVGNWIIIAYFTFDNVWMAAIPPLTFVVINFLSYRFQLFRAMERKERSGNDLGTVYFPLSLFFVVAADFLQFDALTTRALVAILIMTYGDGLSAVVGMRFKSMTLHRNKTLFGSLTMCIVTIIIGVILLENILAILVIAVVATAVELFSPRGFDNLTVPLVSYLLLLIV